MTDEAIILTKRTPREQKLYKQAFLAGMRYAKQSPEIATIKDDGKIYLVCFQYMLKDELRKMKALFDEKAKLKKSRVIFVNKEITGIKTTPKEDKK